MKITTYYSWVVLAIQNQQDLVGSIDLGLQMLEFDFGINSDRVNPLNLLFLGSQIFHELGIGKLRV